MFGKTRAGISRVPLIDNERRLVSAAGFAEAAKRGNCYSGANQTGTVWTVGLATTNTGLCVSNPIGSGKILSILAAGYSEIVAPTGIADAWIAGGYHATTDVAAGVAGTAVNMKLGGAAGVGKVWTGASLPGAPAYLFPIRWACCASARWVCNHSKLYHRCGSWRKRLHCLGRGGRVGCLNR